MIVLSEVKELDSRIVIVRGWFAVRCQIWLRISGGSLGKSEGGSRYGVDYLVLVVAEVEGCDWDTEDVVVVDRVVGILRLGDDVVGVVRAGPKGSREVQGGVKTSWEAQGGRKSCCSSVWLWTLFLVVA